MARIVVALVLMLSSACLAGPRGEFLIVGNARTDQGLMQVARLELEKFRSAEHLSAADLPVQTCDVNSAADLETVKRLKVDTAHLPYLGYCQLNAAGLPTACVYGQASVTAATLQSCLQSLVQHAGLRLAAPAPPPTTYRNTQNGYQLDYPAGCVLTEQSNAIGTPDAIASPQWQLSRSGAWLITMSMNHLSPAEVALTSAALADKLLAAQMRATPALKADTKANIFKAANGAVWVVWSVALTTPSGSSAGFQYARLQTTGPHPAAYQFIVLGRDHPTLERSRPEWERVLQSFSP